MKRQITTLLCTGLVVGLTAPSATTVSEAAKTKLNRTSLSMVAGSTYKLNVKGTKKKIKWRSSKKSVATVSTKGKVTAKKAGSATITATVSRSPSKPLSASWDRKRIRSPHIKRTRSHITKKGKSKENSRLN